MNIAGCTSGFRSKWLAAHLGGQNVLHLHDTGDLLRPAIEHRKTRIIALANLAPVLFGIVLQIEPFELRARRHYCIDAAIAQTQRHLHDRGLGGMDIAGGLRFAQHDGDLFFRYSRGFVRAPRQETQHEIARRGKEPDERRREPGHQRQHRREAERDRLGPAQRDALRHQFAKDQRKVGDHRDNDGEADRPGFRAKAERREIFGDGIGKGRAAQCAGQDADHGDADLYGREEAAWIALQLERDLRTSAAELDAALQADAACGNDGHLGEGEEPVQQDEQKNYGELQPEHGGPDSGGSLVPEYRFAPLNG